MREDLSLIEVYEYLKKEFKSFLKLLWRPIVFLYRRFLFFLYLFIKNYKLFLVLFVLIFIGVTISKKQLFGDSLVNLYEAEAILEPNFESTNRLYGSISYYKKLIVSKDYDQMSKVLRVSKDEAKSIKKIEITPIVKVQDIFKKYNALRDNKDSIISYKGFLTHVKNEDYKSHIVSILSENKYIFKKIEKAIIFDLSKATDVYAKEQKTMLEILKKKEALLSKSLDNISEVVDSYLKNKETERRKTFTQSVPKGYMSFVNTESSKKGDRPIEEMSFLRSRLVISNLIETNKKNILKNSYILKFVSPFPNEGVQVTNVLSRGGIMMNFLIAFMVASALVVAKQMVFFLYQEIKKNDIQEL